MIDISGEAPELVPRRPLPAGVTFQDVLGLHFGVQTVPDIQQLQSFLPDILAGAQTSCPTARKKCFAWPATMRMLSFHCGGAMARTTHLSKCSLHSCSLSPLTRCSGGRAAADTAVVVPVFVPLLPMRSCCCRRAAPDCALLQAGRAGALQHEAAAGSHYSTKAARHAA